MTDARLAVNNGTAVLFGPFAVFVVDYSHAGPALGNVRIYPLMHHKHVYTHHWLDSSYLIPRQIKSIPRFLSIVGGTITDSTVYIFQKETDNKPGRGAVRILNLAGSALLRFKPQTARVYYEGHNSGVSGTPRVNESV